LEVEILDIWTHLDTKTAGLIGQWVPNHEDSAPQCPVGFDPQKAFTKRDKARDVKNGIGIQVMELNPVSEEETAEERMWGEKTSPVAGKQ
jgi:hypothetical protein